MGRTAVGPALVVVTAVMLFALGASAQAGALPEGRGISARYPGDKGIEKDPAVVLAEDFEVKDLSELRARWSDVKNEDGKALFLDRLTPEGSAGSRSLRVTATRGANSGGYVFTVLKPGYDRLFLRFYVRFAEDYGFDHHFCSLSGSVDPPPYPMGGAGLRPENSWGTGVEPTTTSAQTYPFKEFAPPGIWHFYTYWPEMRSWQNEDGTGDSFFGNDFEPETPVIAPRGQWICVEIMVKMNSALDKADGEQAMWIDGKLVGRFGGGVPVSYWIRDVLRNSAEKGKPFAGLRWRHDPKVSINKVKLENYVSDTVFEKSEAYAREHPEFRINTQQATVWFDHVVVSREYVGPLAPATSHP